MTFARARRAPAPAAPDLTCPLDRARYLDELFASSRAEFGTLRMAEGDDPAGGGDTGVATSFTQEQMNENARKSKAEGERSARRKVYTDLGLDPETTKPEDLAAVRDRLKAARDAEDASLSAAEKAKKDAEDDRAAAAKEKAEAAQERHDTRVERALGAAGLDLDDDKTRARALRLLELEVGADSDAVKAAITELKKDMPVLFGAAGQQGGGNGAGDGGGGGRGTTGGNQQTGGGVAARRAKIAAEKREKAGARA